MGNRQEMPGDKGLADQSVRSGLAFAAAAFVFWGLITLYWYALRHVPLLEIVAHRTIWACVVAGLWLFWAGGFTQAKNALADPGQRRTLVFSASVLMFNWSIFIWAVSWGQVLDSSLGYFINPLMSIGLGTLLLGERLNRAQSLAVALAAIAVLIQAVALGHPPWLALLLGGSFAVYGYLRKRAPLPPAPAIFAESTILVPLALIILVAGGSLGWTLPGLPPATANTQFSQVFADPITGLLLLGSGIATAVPLLLFSAAAQRLQLTTMGLMQYIAPSLQFLLAITVLNEPLSWVRLTTFIIIWVALAIVTTDALWRNRAVKSAASN